MKDAHRPRGHERPTRANPVKRYLLTVVLAIGIPALVMAWTVGTVVIKRLNNHILAIAGAEVESFVEAMLPPGKGSIATAPPTSDIGWWRDFGEVQLRNPKTVAVRAYNADGRILYANNPHLVGMQPAMTDSLAKALQGQRAVRLKGWLLTPIERRFTVLVPVQFGANGQTGAIEVVQDIRAVRDELVLVRWLLVGTVVVVSLTFLSALIPLTRMLARSAFFDGLTNLPNRRHLEAVARTALPRSARSGTSASLCLIDLDRFKVINDSLGHAAGDAVLREVASRLQATVRDGDEVARQGGDEFAVLLFGVDEEATNSTVGRIWAVLERPIAMAERSVRINASIGVALFPRDGNDLAALYHRAELAMYRAKSAKVPFTLYHPSYMLAGREGVFLESELRDAIDQGELEVVYQPIVDLVTGSLVAVETLTRWPHPRRGMLSAPHFVPLAEDTGLVRRLDRWVLEQALRQLAEWSERGRDVRRRRLLLGLYQGVELSWLAGSDDQFQQLAPKRPSRPSGRGGPRFPDGICHKESLENGMLC